MARPHALWPHALWRRLGRLEDDALLHAAAAQQREAEQRQREAEGEQVVARAVEQPQQCACGRQVAVGHAEQLCGGRACLGLGSGLRVLGLGLGLG